MQVGKQLKHTKYMDTITFDKVQTILVARRSVTNVTLLCSLNDVTYFLRNAETKTKVDHDKYFEQKIQQYFGNEKYQA